MFSEASCALVAVGAVLWTLPHSIPAAAQGADMPDGVAIYHDMVKRAEWCSIRLGPDLIVVRAKHLQKPLSTLGKRLDELEHKKLGKSVARDEPSHQVRFYATSGKALVELGSIGFWKETSGELRLTGPRTSGAIGIFGDTAKEFISSVRPVVSSYECALEAFETKDRNLICEGFESLAQDRFDGKSKQSIARMESYLSDNDELTRRMAAMMILRMAPTHEKAREIQKRYK